MIYVVAVDVATARPPSPANTRTVYVAVAVDAALPAYAADTEAQLIACQMAAIAPNVVMPIASRILALTL